MSSEKQRDQWREASRRYRERHPERAKEIDRENKRRRNLNPEFREKTNLSKRASGIGITKEEWERMFEGQGRVCAICGSDIPHSKKGWHLDHCHRTKTVRFILCTHCNRGLGGFQDSPELLRRAADALEHFNRNNEPKVEDEWKTKKWTDQKLKKS